MNFASLKSESIAVFFAARHPETPWHAKLLLAVIAAYAFSPIDLIPDFIPFFGYLDDIVLIPMGIALAMKMIPPSVMAECRARAHEAMALGKPVSRVGAAMVVAIWMGLAALCLFWVYRAIADHGAR